MRPVDIPVLIVDRGFENGTEIIKQKYIDNDRGIVLSGRYKE